MDESIPIHRDQRPRMAKAAHPQKAAHPHQPHANAFEKAIRRLSHRHALWQVFADFCECAAISLANALERREEREARYLRIVGRYERDELNELCRLLGAVIEALEADRSDFLGPLFMGLDLGNHWNGQFFTAPVVCDLIARVLFDAEDVREKIERSGFLTVQEPACGGGAMLIAFAEEMRRHGFHSHEHLVATVIDIDATAAHMCFIQLALLHVPAIVVIGNTLTGEVREVFHTPAYHMGGWDLRLRLRSLLAWTVPCEGEAREPTLLPAPAADELPPPSTERLASVMGFRQPDVTLPHAGKQIDLFEAA